MEGVRVACHASVFLSGTSLRAPIMRVSRKLGGVSCRLALRLFNHVNGFSLSVFADERLYLGNMKVISSNYRGSLKPFERLDHLLEGKFCRE